MRQQKPKNRTNSSNAQNRFQGNYLDDISCKFCANYRGKKKGCILPVCDFEGEKMDAIKHGRIKRKAGDAI